MGGLYTEGRFNGGFFALRFWGAYIWRALFSEFYSISAFLASTLLYRLLNLKQVTSQEGRLKSDGSGVLQNENESVVSEAHESPGLYE